MLAAGMSVLPGCSVVSSIFKAGMYWAFFLVLLFVVLIIWIVARARK